jgi:hypothetical protein
MPACAWSSQADESPEIPDPITAIFIVLSFFYGFIARYSASKAAQAA